MTWVTVLGLALAWVLLGALVAPGARKHDFLNLYTGASLAVERNFSDMYNYDVQLARERSLVPELPSLVPFVRPHFYAVLLAPLARIPFRAAFWCWLALHTSLLLFCWRWALGRFGPDALIFAALYLPAALGIASGQDCVLMLAIAIGAYTLAEDDRYFWSGALLGLGLLKFHLLVLFPLAMLLGRRWKMLAGFSLAGAALGSFSLLVSGWRGGESYIGLLRRKDLERLAPSPEKMVDIYALPANLGIQSPWLSAALAALVVLLAVIALWRAPLWRWFSTAWTGSLLAAPHVYGYDATVLLLPVWLVIFCSTRPATRLAATAAAVPLFFFMSLAQSPWSAAPALVLLTLLVTLAVESAVPVPQPVAAEPAEAKAKAAAAAAG